MPKNLGKYTKKNYSLDLERVRDLVLQLDPAASVSEQSFREALLHGYMSTVYDGDLLIGMGWIFPRQTLLRKQAVIEDMVVDVAYRKKGYGERILRDLIDWALRNSIEVIELTTSPQRIAANSLYKKYGFVLHETNHYLLDVCQKKQAV
jgi:GNAT superfamily N-acetyltransferase